MDGMLSLTANLSAAPDDCWIQVFRQRGVWCLTRGIIDRWVARNAVFFDMLCRHVPHGGRVLELGCGPGRHAISAATLGYSVLGLDVEPSIIAQAKANARAAAPECAIAFQTGDLFDLDAVAPPNSFDAITHGGVMEHFDSAGSIRESLHTQLHVAPVIIFDVPIDTAKNRVLFARDDIFRQLWTADEWVHDALAGLDVIEARTDLHPDPNMTDDLVVCLYA